MCVCVCVSVCVYGGGGEEGYDHFKGRWKEKGNKKKIKMKETMYCRMWDKQIYGLSQVVHSDCECNGRGE